jgi:hypothetical protein
MQSLRSRSAQSAYEPVCCIRVAAASPATVLPLGKTAGIRDGENGCAQAQGGESGKGQVFHRNSP